MINDRWLTSRRLRAHGLLLALTLWGLYTWTLATPTLRDRNGNLKGTDFLHFYTLGTLALEHRGGELYDMNAQAAVAAERVPDAAGIRYLPLYPPQVSLLFAPLVRLSYGWALAVWWMLAALIYGACCFEVWQACANLTAHGSVVGLLAVGFPGFFHLIVWGQTSAIALAFFAGSFLLLRNRREFAAGLVLGCLIFKPQLGLAAAFVFVSIGAWRIVAGAVLSAGLQLSVGVLYYGAMPLREWLGVLWHLRASPVLFEPRPYQTHCLRTFWAMFLPWSGLALALYVLSAAMVVALTISIWRSRGSLGLRYSALLLATVLISPHLTVYDLAILAPAFLLVADELISHHNALPGTPTVLYLTYLTPILALLTRWTKVQLSVIAMTALLYQIWRIANVPQAGAGRAAQMEIALL